MQSKTAPKLNFLPLYGGWLGVAMKAVTSDNQTHVPLPGKSLRHLLDDSGFNKAEATFEKTLLNPNRITIHFWRDWENNFLPRMVSCRFQDRDRTTGEIKEGKSFGFSLENYEKSFDGKQQFLQLVYVSKDKPKGFEPLYLKIEVPQKKGFAKPVYLKIELRENNSSDKTHFIVTAEEVPKNSVPNDLQRALIMSEVPEAEISQR